MLFALPLPSFELFSQLLILFRDTLDTQSTLKTIVSQSLCVKCQFCFLFLILVWKRFICIAPVSHSVSLMDSKYPAPQAVIFQICSHYLHSEWQLRRIDLLFYYWFKGDLLNSEIICRAQEKYLKQGIKNKNGTLLELNALC